MECLSSCRFLSQPTGVLLYHQWKLSSPSFLILFLFVTILNVLCSLTGIPPFDHSCSKYVPFIVLGAGDVAVNKPCVRACVCVHVCMCVRACMCVHACIEINTSAGKSESQCSKCHAAGNFCLSFKFQTRGHLIHEDFPGPHGCFNPLSLSCSIDKS